MMTRMLTLKMRIMTTMMMMLMMMMMITYVLQCRKAHNDGPWPLLQMEGSTVRGV